MVDRIVGYRVAAGVLAVAALVGWINFARAFRDAGPYGGGGDFAPGTGVGFWLAVAVSATVFSAGSAAVASVASLLLLHDGRAAAPGRPTR